MPQADYTSEHYRDLLRKYQIEFEPGPVVPHRWPCDYKDIFQNIRTISRIWMEEYVNVGHRDPLPLAEKRHRVTHLRKSALQSLKQQSTEEEWREWTEAQVFSRFHTEVVCMKCRKYFWLSDFEPWPIDFAEARRVQERREKQRICTCSLTERLDADVNDDGRAPLFVRRLGKRVYHADAEELKRDGIDKQLPDRVIGLGLTKSFEHYTRLNSNVHSPFKGNDVVYPFIVIEAKPENGPGWQSIQCQGAFALRTCLKMQQKLETSSGRPHQSLVWFFAFRGEEWRLYAAVPQEDKTRVIDLWHGSIVSEDGALQLCLIVDYLCTWAREDYRESILGCLAGGDAHLRRFTTPLSSRMSSQLSEIVVSSHCEVRNLPLRMSEGPDLRRNDSAGEADMSHAEPVESETTPEAAEVGGLNEKDPYHWRRWLKNDQAFPEWAEMATIRHANLTRQSFGRFDMPGEQHELQASLSICFPGVGVQEAAKRILVTMLDESVSITVGNDVDACFSPGSKVFIYQRHFFRPQDWQIERRWLCITCRPKALSHLAAIVGVSEPFGNVGKSRPIQWCKCFMRSVRLLSGREIAALAVSDTQQYVRPAAMDHGLKHAQLTRFNSGFHGGLTSTDLYALSAAIADGASRYSYMTMHQGHTIRTDQRLTEEHADILDLTNLRSSPGIIIKKPPHWPSSTPDFCFLVLEQEIDFADSTELGRLMREARKRGNIFGLGDLRPSESLLLNRWIKILEGTLPEDTPLA